MSVDPGRRRIRFHVDDRSTLAAVANAQPWRDQRPQPPPNKTKEGIRRLTFVPVVFDQGAEFLDPAPLTQAFEDGTPIAMAQVKSTPG